MSRWMMWALMGMIVTALVVAGCDHTSVSDPSTEANVYARNTVTGGHTVDVHIVPGAPASSPDISSHTPDVSGLAPGGNPPWVTVDPGNYVILFVLAGTDQVLGRAYITLGAGDSVTAELTGDASTPPTVVIN